MTKRRKILVSILAPLYIVTWVGGWITYADQLRADTEARYRNVERRNQELAAWAYQIGDTDFRPIRLNKKPASRVNWCVPLIPGILLADSDYFIGPLSAEGGGKIVLYYGIGSTELCPLWRWLA